MSCRRFAPTPEQRRIGVPLVVITATKPTGLDSWSPETRARYQARWRALRAELEIMLVRGNHDRHAGDPPDDLRINCVNAPAFVPPCR